MARSGIGRPTRPERVLTRLERLRAGERALVGVVRDAEAWSRAWEEKQAEARERESGESLVVAREKREGGNGQRSLMRPDATDVKDLAVFRPEVGRSALGTEEAGRLVKDIGRELSQMAERLAQGLGDGLGDGVSGSGLGSAWTPVLRAQQSGGSGAPGARLLRVGGESLGGSVLGTVAQLLAGLFPDQKAERLEGIAQTLQTKVAGPAGVDRFTDSYGRTLDRNLRGDLRVVQPVTVQVQAMDAKGFLERAEDIGNAVKAALQGGHDVADSVRGLIFSR